MHVVTYVRKHIHIYITLSQVRREALSLYYKLKGLKIWLGDWHLMQTYIDAIEKIYEPLITPVAAYLRRRKLKREDLSKNVREHRFFLFGLCRQVMMAMLLQMAEDGSFRDGHLLFCPEGTLRFDKFSDVVTKYQDERNLNGTFRYMVRVIFRISTSTDMLMETEIPHESTFTSIYAK